MTAPEPWPGVSTARCLKDSDAPHLYAVVEELRAAGPRGRTARQLAEQHDEWTEMRRYIGIDVLTKSRLTLIEPTPEPEEVTTTAITA